MEIEIDTEISVYREQDDGTERRFVIDARAQIGTRTHSEDLTHYDEMRDAETGEIVDVLADEEICAREDVGRWIYEQRDELIGEVYG